VGAWGSPHVTYATYDPYDPYDPPELRPIPVRHNPCNLAYNYPESMQKWY